MSYQKKRERGRDRKAALKSFLLHWRMKGEKRGVGNSISLPEGEGKGRQVEPVHFTHL